MKLLINDTLSYALALCAQALLCVSGTLLNLVCLFAFITTFANAYYRKTSLLIYLVALNVCNAVQLSLSVLVIIFPATEQVNITVYLIVFYCIYFNSTCYCQLFDIRISNLSILSLVYR